MNKEEAIKELELIAKVTMWNDRREAVEMAIEALQRDIERDEMVIRASEKYLGIVRCKDCRHWNWETKGCKRNPSVAKWRANDFCNHGERSEK